MAFFILTRFVLVNNSCAFVETPSQGNFSLASRLTTVSLDTYVASLVWPDCYFLQGVYRFHFYMAFIAFSESD